MSPKSLRIWEIVLEEDQYEFSEEQVEAGFLSGEYSKEKEVTD